VTGVPVWSPKSSLPFPDTWISERVSGRRYALRVFPECADAPRTRTVARDSDVAGKDKEFCERVHVPENRRSFILSLSDYVGWMRAWDV
jgi:hypothetical protein